MGVVRVTDRVRLTADARDLSWMTRWDISETPFGVLLWLSSFTEEDSLAVERVAVVFDESAQEVVDAVRWLVDEHLVEVVRDEDDVDEVEIVDGAGVLVRRVKGGGGY